MCVTRPFLLDKIIKWRLLRLWCNKAFFICDNVKCESCIMQLFVKVSPLSGARYYG